MTHGNKGQAQKKQERTLFTTLTDPGPLERSWNLFVRKGNSFYPINTKPLNNAEFFFRYFSLFEKPSQATNQKVEILLILAGKTLEEVSDKEKDKDQESNLEVLQWSVRYGLKVSKNEGDAFWSDVVYGIVGETFPHSEKIVAVSVAQFPMHITVSVYIYDPELQLPIASKDTRKEYISEIIPKNLVTVEWKNVFEYNENLKSSQK